MYIYICALYEKNQFHECLYLLVPFDNNRGHNPAQTDPWFHMNGAVPKWCPIFVLYASHTKTLPANWLLSCIAAPRVLFLVGWDNGRLPYLTIICSIFIFLHLPHIFGFPSHLGSTKRSWKFPFNSLGLWPPLIQGTKSEPSSNQLKAKVQSNLAMLQLWMKGSKVTRSYYSNIVDVFDPHLILIHKLNVSVTFSYDQRMWRWLFHGLSLRCCSWCVNCTIRARMDFPWTISTIYIMERVMHRRGQLFAPPIYFWQNLDNLTNDIQGLKLHSPDARSILLIVPA